MQNPELYVTVGLLLKAIWVIKDINTLKTLLTNLNCTKKGLVFHKSKISTFTGVDMQFWQEKSPFYCTHHVKTFGLEPCLVTCGKE